MCACVWVCLCVGVYVAIFTFRTSRKYAIPPNKFKFQDLKREIYFINFSIRELEEKNFCSLD